MPHFVAHRRVEFCDTDMAGIVHFANFFKYMEQAEHDFFRSLDLKIAGRLPDGTEYGWPRVSATCSYDSPGRYDDVIEIHVTITRRAARSLTTTYEFHCDGKLLARGEMKTVFCVIPAGGPMKSAAIPDDIAAKLDQAASS
ncbi:MAG TPA: thioesterase family protein [Planctomycetaceae bacterium]|nr:thioesterase family protein [Planctomycetaceae bacterium]